MRLTNQVAAVIIVGIIGVAGMVVCLALWADWSDGAVIGMLSGIGAAVTAAIVAVRGQAKTQEAVDQVQMQVGAGQRITDRKLETVVRQTNGMTSEQIGAVADAAADAAVQRYVAGQEAA
jgi:hypothetical protein